MQKSTIKGLAVSALFLGMFAAVQTASAAPEGIRNTRHNLGSGSLAAGASGIRTNGIAGSTGMGDVFTNATTEICVFCHTPHGANTDVPVPLWNKGSLASTTYTVFKSGTMQGLDTTNGSTNLAGHMSLACLSCHDGTQAMDNMVNQPGQGGYNAQGVRLGIDAKLGTGTPANWFAGDNNMAVAEQNAGDTSGGKLIAGAGIDFIGTDLSNDHPIGMKYAGGGCSSVGANTGCADSDFHPARAGLNGFFEVTGATAGTAGNKANMRLYGQTLSSATVECASCHDPHSDAQATFLRASNASSGVCLTCHNK